MDLSGFGAESWEQQVAHSEYTGEGEQRSKRRKHIGSSSKVAETIRRDTANDVPTLSIKGESAFRKNGDNVGRTGRKRRNSLTAELQVIIVSIIRPKGSVNALECPQRGRQRQWQQGQ